jgi:hypothetical protein
MPEATKRFRIIYLFLFFVLPDLLSILTFTMGDEKRAPAREKIVLLFSLYILNYSSNFKLLKSLTQLGKWATPPKVSSKTIYMLCAPFKESPKKPIFWK